MTEARKGLETSDALPSTAGIPEAGDDARGDIDDDAGDRPGGGEAEADAGAGDRPATPARRRPLLERIGMAAIALVLAALFGAVALAALAGGEPFLGAMAGIGCLMTLWVGGLTLVRG